MIFPPKDSVKKRRLSNTALLLSLSQLPDHFYFVVNTFRVLKVWVLVKLWSHHRDQDQDSDLILKSNKICIVLLWVTARTAFQKSAIQYPRDYNEIILAF